MNTIDRNRLLMEANGINCANIANDLSIALKNSPLYLESMLRLQHASLTDIPSIVKDYVSLRDLDFAITTMADYVVLENYVVEYALHSFPSWWTNPFEDEKDKNSPNSLGQLLIKNKNKVMTIDKLIEDENTSKEEKKEIIRDRVEGWHNDQVERLVTTVNKVKNRDGRSLLNKNATTFFTTLLLIVGNIYVIYCFCNGLLNQFASQPDWSYISTYALYLPLIFTLIYDLVYAITISVQSKRENGFDYVIYFSKKKQNKMLTNLSNLTIQFLNYLYSYVDNGLPIENNSINKFNFSGSSKVKGLLAIAKQPSHKIVDMLYVVYSWIYFFALVFSLVIVIMDIQRGIAI